MRVEILMKIFPRHQNTEPITELETWEISHLYTALRKTFNLTPRTTTYQVIRSVPDYAIDDFWAIGDGISDLMSGRGQNESRKIVLNCIARLDNILENIEWEDYPETRYFQEEMLSITNFTYEEAQEYFVMHDVDTTRASMLTCGYISDDIKIH